MSGEDGSKDDDLQDWVKIAEREEAQYIEEQNIIKHIKDAPSKEVKTNQPNSPWVTVYCPDVDLLERSKKVSINRSRLFTEALRIAVDQGERSLITLLELEETRSQSIRVKQRIATLEEEIKANEEFSAKISVHLDELEQQEALVQRANMLSELFIALNKICVENKYEIEAIEMVAGELLEVAKKELPEFELQAHVIRLRDLLTPF